MLLLHRFDDRIEFLDGSVEELSSRRLDETRSRFFRLHAFRESYYFAERPHGPIILCILQDTNITYFQRSFGCRKLVVS